MIYAGLLIVIAVVVYLMWKKKPAEQPKQDKPKLDESTATVSPTIKNGEKVTVVKDGVKTEGTVKILPAGFQIFNNKGQIIFDLDDISYVVYGSGDTGYSDGSISDARITDKSFIFVYYSEREFLKDVAPEETFHAMENEMEAFPLLKIKNGQISWSYNSTMAKKYHKIRYKFFYGGVPLD